MIRWHRTTLSSSLALVLLCLAPSVLGASPKDKDKGKEKAEPEAASGDASPAENPEEAKPTTPPPDLGGWGVGGKDDNGKFGPAGKTGKLKQIEHEEAEKRKEVAPNLPPPGYAYLDTVIGFGSIRVVAQPTGATGITPTASFLIGAGYRFDDTWLVGLRFPISTGSSNGPVEPVRDGGRDPDSYKQIAVGGVELELKPAFILSSTLRLPAGLAFVLPSGMGDQNLTAERDNRNQLGQAIVNLAADGSRGFEDRAIFAHKRFGLVPSIGIAFKDGAIEINAATKLEIMIRTGGQDPLPLDEEAVRLAFTQQEIRKAAVNWVTSASFHYWIADGLFTPGLRVWLAAGTAGDYKDDQDYSGAEFALEPQVKMHVPFTEDKQVGFDAGLGYVIPLGNALRGADSYISGLRIHTGLFF